MRDINMPYKIEIISNSGRVLPLYLGSLVLAVHFYRQLVFSVPEVRLCTYRFDLKLGYLPTSEVADLFPCFRFHGSMYEEAITFAKEFALEG